MLVYKILLLSLIILVSLGLLAADNLDNQIPEHPDHHEGEINYPLSKLPQESDMLKMLKSMVEQDLAQDLVLAKKNLDLKLAEAESLENISNGQENINIGRFQARYQLAKRLMGFRVLMSQGSLKPQVLDKFIEFIGNKFSSRTMSEKVIFFDEETGLGFEKEITIFVPDNIRFYYSYILANAIEMQAHLGILKPETVEKVGQHYMFLFKTKWWPMMDIKNELLRHFAQIILDSHGKIPKNFWQLIEDVPELEVKEGESMGEVHLWPGKMVRVLQLLTLSYDDLSLVWQTQIQHLQNDQTKIDELNKKLDPWLRAISLLSDLEMALPKKYQNLDFMRFVESGPGLVAGLADYHQEAVKKLESRELSYLDRVYRRQMNSLMVDWGQRWEIVKGLHGMGRP